MTDFLTVVALLRPWSPFEDSCVTELSRNMEEALSEEASCVAILGEVDHHGAVCLEYVLLAQLCHLRYCSVVFLVESLCRSAPDLSTFIQHG